jgi:Protein of unknown function (DUF1064)
MKSNKRYFMGYLMDSDTEWQRAVYLYDLCQQGIIRDLILDKAQLKVTLVEGVKVAKHPLRPRGAKLGAISYTPDFQYHYQDALIVEDVKGKYGDTKKNRAKGIAGKAIVTPASRLRIRLYQILHPTVIFRICTIPTSDIDDIAEYEWF